MKNSLFFLMVTSVVGSGLLISHCEKPVEYSSNVDTLYISNNDTIITRDSIFIFDTLAVKDSLYLARFDTIIFKDTVYNYDTVTVRDSSFQYDTVISIDSIFSFDTVVIRDSMFTYDTVINIINVINRDTVFIKGSSKVHVFFGQFSTAADSVSRDENEWEIVLPITIKKDWTCFSYTSGYAEWVSQLSIDKYLSMLYSGSGFVLYGFNGTIYIWDIDLELKDRYWKIVLIEPL